MIALVLMETIKDFELVMVSLVESDEYPLIPSKECGDFKIGGEVIVDCYTSFGTMSTEIITDIQLKYDQDTGEGYRIICIGDHHFDSRTGEALTPPLMYYIGDYDDEL